MFSFTGSDLIKPGILLLRDEQTITIIHSLFQTYFGFRLTKPPEPTSKIASGFEMKNGRSSPVKVKKRQKIYCKSTNISVQENLANLARTAFSLN